MSSAALCPQLKANGVSYNKGTFPFAANSRARANDVATGFVKVLAHKDSDKLLGAWIMGPEAGELIGQLVLGMEYGAAAEDLGRTCVSHPTLSEAVKEACMACYDKPIHMASAGPREEDAATFIARAHPRKWREKSMSKSREDAEAGDPERAGESTKNGETGACPSTRNRALTTKTARAKTGDWRVRGNRSQTEARGRKRQRSEARGANRFFSSCGRTDSEGRASSLETKARRTFSRPSSTCLFRLVPSSRAVVR
ncbi:pyruvate dehydrogenase complex subunit PDH-E3II [Toxoplasma gondii CAST]|uniref:Pyruvate dehydrogenase complex subunit PDH-E3II n=1 Tax=Toxoplasma gondii CAST TaxID=943122 RepID=A0A425I2S0_TOXGO|nr:pyruvate dehydrogenase complex subunit PDH-E3II [Toxoplasma gondii CAST]